MVFVRAVEATLVDLGGQVNANFTYSSSDIRYSRRDYWFYFTESASRVRSHLVHALVQLDRDHVASDSTERWEDVYAQGLIERFCALT